MPKYQRDTTQQDIDKMVELYEQGYSTGEIGDAFQKDHTTITHHLQKRGVQLDVRRRRKRKKPKKKLRDIKKERNQQMAEDAKTMDRIQIGKKYGITPNRVTVILRTLGVKAVRAKPPKKKKKKTDWREQCRICGSKEKNFKFHLSPYCSLECFKATIPKDEKTINEWIKENKKKKTQ